MGKTFKVLVLCTGNSARSILGEMLFNHLGKGRIEAHSAGSKPGGTVNPVALETLAKHGVPGAGARSKSWDEFAAAGSPEFDFIFTVCGNAAQEACPVWPGHPATAHWSYPDPSEGDGTDAQKLEAFRKTLLAIKRRLELFCSLPNEKLGAASLQSSARQLANT